MYIDWLWNERDHLAQHVNSSSWYPVKIRAFIQKAIGNENMTEP